MCPHAAWQGNNYCLQRIKAYFLKRLQGIKVLALACVLCDPLNHFREGELAVLPDCFMKAIAGSTYLEQNGTSCIAVVSVLPEKKPPEKQC